MLGWRSTRMVRLGWEYRLPQLQHRKMAKREEVHEEWTMIAKEFPFLELTCQLMEHEAGPDDGLEKPAIEFRIKAGKVTMKEPKKAITITSFGTADMVERFSNPHAERGCTFEMFKQALDHTRSVGGKA